LSHRCSNLAALPLATCKEIGCDNQPPTLAAMEDFRITEGAPLAISGSRRGQERLDNHWKSQHAEFLTYRHGREHQGLSDFRRRMADQIPCSITAIRDGRAGTISSRDGPAALLQWRGKLYDSRWMLWILMVCVPFPYIANTAGWMTANSGATLADL